MPTAINAYMKPGENGDAIFMAEEMIVDWVAMMKGNGFTLEQVHAVLNEVWPKVKMEITIPDKIKN